MLDDIHYLGLVEAGRLIRQGALSSVQVTEALLARIDRLEPQLNAFVQLLADDALAEAEEADREIAAGHGRGPLHGVPIGIKDLLEMTGLETGCGGYFTDGAIARRDATAITRLRHAGAVLIGKLRLTEGAAGGHHPDFPRPENPWKPAHWPGLSSSGSGVATAAGLCFAALGTDTGGSIRMPSGACGLSGIKPTWGRVSRHGLYPLSPSFDHLGPMARSVEDAAALLQVIAGEDPADPTTLPGPLPNFSAGLDHGMAGLRFGYDPALTEEGVDPLIAANIRETCELLSELGAIVRPIALPAFLPVAGQVIPLMTAEVAASHAHIFPERADLYGPVLRETLERAERLTAVDIARAYEVRLIFTAQLNRALADIDVLLVPAAAVPTPSWDTYEATDPAELMKNVLRYTIPLDASGHPTLSLPTGFGPSGLPYGVQFVAAHGAEALLVQAGHAFQRATGFHSDHPDL